jgi:multidrug efflux pump subunit AcrA (membrane-fusion protein)
MRKTAQILLMILIGTVLLAGCNKSEAAGGAQTAAQAPVETVYAVNTFIAKPDNLDAYLEFGGEVEAASSVDILPEATGKLSAIFVKPGDYVQRDQRIALVDPSRPGLNYEESPVRSPISGTVTSFPLPIGATVAPSMSIGKISTANDLEVTINVAERFVSRIRMNQTALLAFDAYPSETFTARVVEISPVLNTVSRTMTVKLRLVEPDARVKIGMYARVKLITDERRNVIVIPNDALVRRAGGTYMFVVNPADERVRMVDVDEGIRVDDRIEILSGISAGDEVVVKGQTLLDNGSKVNVISVINEGAN